ncbi:MAG TPA: NADH-quinone oxidoreductase subunit N [Thermoanaerobaculia bacterium]|nr:NADH-quinone oxidoreductase subunit N [Thermoanaerobaculia bacterium]
MTWSDLIWLAPEIVVALGASWLVLAPFVMRGSGVGAAKWQMLAILAVAGGVLVWASNTVTGMEQSSMFRAMFVLDGFAVFFKLLFVGAIALIVLLSEDFLREARYSPWEYFSLMAFALCGMMFMVSGVHLISIWIGLELLSLSSYVLAGYFKDEAVSTEAAMKYFILGTISSAILLYGMSLIYGVTGSLALMDISRTLSGLLSNDVLVFGIILLAAGLSFKVAAVPFHVWTPDVYVGAPTPVTAFLSTASKAAAFAIFARIFYMGLSEFHLDWSGVIAGIAALSMIVGNLAAITQDNVKRMIAWSSIGHAGYALLGILAMSEAGLIAIVVYMVVYVFATMGIWALVLMLRRREYAGESVADFAGLHARAPLWAFAMVVFLLSLGGIPPTAGFIGKYYLFLAAVGAGYAWLAVIAVLMSAVSMFYYFRLVVAMYLRDDPGAELVGGGSIRLVAAACLLITLGLGVAPQPMLEEVGRSLQSLIAVTLR